MKFLRMYRLYRAVVFPIYWLLYRPRYLHRERLPEQGPFLVFAPHSSLADPVFLVFLLGRERMVRFMAKKELEKVPLLGALLRWIGTFWVDRGTADMQAIRTAMRILKEGGIVGIFPEGTRVHEEGGGEAKTGVVMLAAHSGVPIVPVYLPRDKKLFRRVTLVVGEPYRVEKTREGYEAQAEELMRRMQLLKEELS